MCAKIIRIFCLPGRSLKILALWKDHAFYQMVFMVLCMVDFHVTYKHPRHQCTSGMVVLHAILLKVHFALNGTYTLDSFFNISDGDIYSGVELTS